MAEKSSTDTEQSEIEPVFLNAFSGFPEFNERSDLEFALFEDDEGIVNYKISPVRVADEGFFRSFNFAFDGLDVNYGGRVLLCDLTNYNKEEVVPIHLYDGFFHAARVDGLTTSSGGLGRILCYELQSGAVGFKELVLGNADVVSETKQRIESIVKGYEIQEERARMAEANKIHSSFFAGMDHEAWRPRGMHSGPC
jgi:hypothetical protein